MEGLRMVTKAVPNWVIDVTEACQKRGIENPYQLWQKIGGSKATTAQLFSGASEMIRTETMNRLHDILGISPFEYILNRKDN
jgi:DNA-binding Xre family transcriptional regulator